MGNYSLAIRYAQALLGEIPAEQTGQAAEEVREAAELWRQSEVLRGVMLNPFIPVEEKAEAMQQIGERAGWLEVVRHFLGVLVSNERIALLPELVPMLGDLMRAREGRDEALIESPVALSEEETKRIVGRLGEQLGLTLIPRVAVDPALIGGVRVRVGDTLFDATVAGNLETLREALTEG